MLLQVRSPRHRAESSETTRSVRWNRELTAGLVDLTVSNTTTKSTMSIAAPSWTRTVRKGPGKSWCAGSRSTDQVTAEGTTPPLR